MTSHDNYVISLLIVYAYSLTFHYIPIVFLYVSFRIASCSPIVIVLSPYGYIIHPFMSLPCSFHMVALVLFFIVLLMDLCVVRLIWDVPLCFYVYKPM